jgi:hypothetical protein
MNQENTWTSAFTDPARRCAARPAAARRYSIAFRLAIAGVAALGTLPASAGLEPGCPDHYYLGNNPANSDWPDWSENAQGVANDGQHWFFTHVAGLIKYQANWYGIGSERDSGHIKSVGIPDVLRSRAINHFGDLDQYGGYLFVPFEGDPELCTTYPWIYPCQNGPLIAVIAVFRASDLEFVDWVNVEPYQRRAGWVAIDPVEKVLYTSTDTLVEGTKIQRYAIDMDKVDNDIYFDFLQPLDPVDVRDVEGQPIYKQFKYLQGGVFTPWGDLYLSAGTSDDPPSDVRGGLHLFRRTNDGTAFELIDSSVNAPAEVGQHVFSYEYHPADLGGQEPEGIDWWNRDRDPGSTYPGQLHAILLDNDAGDDSVWLKHYRVVNLCTYTDDTDNDGLPDGDETYAYNTHPLIADTDRDGQSDGHELHCGSNPLDADSLAPDADGDDIPNCVDADDDNDGQSDADEAACGSNSRDSTSLAPDFDGDLRPDCVDADDDNDGTSDTADLCAATPLDLGAIGYAGCSSGVDDFLLTSQAGCSVSQWIDVLATDSKTKGQLVNKVDKLLNELQKQDLIAPHEKDAVKGCVAQ